MNAFRRAFGRAAPIPIKNFVGFAKQSLTSSISGRQLLIPKADSGQAMTTRKDIKNEQKTMDRKIKLTKQITETQFDNGYWYANEIKAFAKEIGIPNSSKLRKDELEMLIKIFLRTGKVKSSDRKNIQKSGIKDLEKGLDNSLQIINYTSNKQTQNFILNEALKIVPVLKVKSGVWYRLNRWREEQITKGKRITYGDLINQFINLNQTDLKFEKISVGRYINFLSDFLAYERGATRQQAIIEWKILKTLTIEKDYKSWKQYMKNKNPNR